MSILNRPSDGLLSVLIALRSGLLAYGPQPETELLELVAPASVVADGKPDMAKKTLTRWKQLSFFQETRGAVSLSPSIASIAADDTDGLRAAILRIVLAPENNPRLQAGDGEDDEKSMASDCSWALAWVLAQDPYSFPLVYAGVELLQSRQEVSPRVFANDTRWQGLVEWAVFLGAGFTSTRSGLTLCPAFAVRTYLDEVFQTATELGQAEFFLRLAEALPIVDGGQYRMIVEAQTARPWRSLRPSEVSPSLSAALQALEAAGTLRLEMRSDAPTRTLLGREGAEVHGITHIIRTRTA
jgi:hypothetical protein